MLMAMSFSFVLKLLLPLPTQPLLTPSANTPYHHYYHYYCTTIEYAFFDVILYADGDEFFFCPQATTKEVLEQQVLLAL